MHTKYKKHGLKGIFVAFSSETLRQTDKVLYDKLGRILPNCHIHTSVGFDTVIDTMTKDDLLILDEGDWHLLDQCCDLPKEKYGVFALTATDVGSNDGVEQRRLDYLKFKVFQSKIPSNFDVTAQPQAIDADKFLDRRRRKRARLIYCHVDSIPYFRKLAEDMWFYTCLVNHNDFKQLRKLTKDTCVIVSDVDKMRGVDYRANDGSGIDLLICTDFPHTRAYQQGLGRVGRYGE